MEVAIFILTVTTSSNIGKLFLHVQVYTGKSLKSVVLNYLDYFISMIQFVFCFFCRFFSELFCIHYFGLHLFTAFNIRTPPHLSMVYLPLMSTKGKLTLLLMTVSGVVFGLV